MDCFVSQFTPELGNEGAIVSVDASHPPDLDRLYAQRTLGGGQPSCPTDPDIRVELCDRELWEQFSQVGTEMIVTKSGRRMFPGYRVKLSGLDPTAKYCVLMDIVNVDQHRYKFQQGEWMVAGRGEPHVPQRLFVHPDSPSSGEKWMNDVVSFYKIKLSNSAVSKTTDKIVLNSMHRYQPRVHIVRADDVTKLSRETFSTFAFPQTVFITVTAYQNGQVTKLKIDNNPFAKGFRENGGRSTTKSLHSAGKTNSKLGRENSNPCFSGDDNGKTKRVKVNNVGLPPTHQPISKPDQLRNWMTSPNAASPSWVVNETAPVPFHSFPYYPTYHSTEQGQLPNYSFGKHNYECVTSQNLFLGYEETTKRKYDESVYSMLHSTAACPSTTHPNLNPGGFPKSMFLC